MSLVLVRVRVGYRRRLRAAAAARSSFERTIISSLRALLRAYRTAPTSPAWPVVARTRVKHFHLPKISAATPCRRLCRVQIRCGFHFSARAPFLIHADMRFRFQFVNTRCLPRPPATPSRSAERRRAHAALACTRRRSWSACPPGRRYRPGSCTFVTTISTALPSSTCTFSQVKSMTWFRRSAQPQHTSIIH